MISGKVENVYITVCQIYWGHYIPSFIRIGWLSFKFKISQKHFGVFFFDSQCMYRKLCLSFV